MNATELLAARALQISASGHFDAKNTEAVPSPCISVCRMSSDRSHCEGCFRTLDEIRIWARADAHLRRGIWQQLMERSGIAARTPAPTQTDTPTPAQPAKAEP